MRPPKSASFTEEELEHIKELEDEVATYLETHSECLYNTNTGLGTSDHLRDEVWDELVKHANAVGYDAERTGASVTIKNPKHT